VWLVRSLGTVSHYTFVRHLHYQISKSCSRHICSLVPTSLTNCFQSTSSEHCTAPLYSDSSHVLCKLFYYYYYYFNRFRYLLAYLLLLSSIATAVHLCRCSPVVSCLTVSPLKLPNFRTVAGRYGTNYSIAAAFTRQWRLAD